LAMFRGDKATAQTQVRQAESEPSGTPNLAALARRTFTDAPEVVGLAGLLQPAP